MRSKDSEAERSMMDTMIQAHKGYFQAGRFVPTDNIQIPDNLEVYVVVTEKEVAPTMTRADRQRQALDEFTRTIAGTEPLGEDFDEVMKQGVHFREALDL